MVLLLALLHGITHCCELYITGYHNPKILLNQNHIQYFTIHFVTELIIVITCMHNFTFGDIELNLLYDVCGTCSEFSVSFRLSHNSPPPLI